MTRRLLLAAFGAGFLLAGGTMSRLFPPVHTDEAFIAVHGVNLLSGHGQRYSLYDDFFAPSAYNARDAFGEISLTLTNTWFGLGSKIFSKSYWHIRWASLIAGFLTLLLFYELGKHWLDPVLGFTLVFLLVTDPVFLISSCLIRPEILVLLSGSVILWSMVKIPDTFRWKSFILGSLCGLMMSIHPNAMSFWLGICVFQWFYPSRMNKYWQTATFALGLLSGIVASFMVVNLPKYILSYKMMFYELYRPPLLTWPWTPAHWMYSTLAGYLSGETAYFDTSLVAGWRGCLSLRWIGLGLCVAGGIIAGKKIRALPRWHMALGGAFLASLLGMGLLLQRKEVNYYLLLYPFLIPFIGGFLQQIRISSRRRRGSFFAVLGGLALVASGIQFALFVNRYRATGRPLDQVTREVELLINNDHLKVAGPDVLWFGWNPDKFRDIGALIYSHWYTGGQLDLSQWLGRWRPDILIFDEPLKHLLYRGYPLAVRLSQLLDMPVDYLGSVETGRGAYGTFEIYQIHWSAYAKNS